MCVVGCELSGRVVHAAKRQKRRCATIRCYVRSIHRLGRRMHRADADTHPHPLPLVLLHTLSPRPPHIPHAKMPVPGSTGPGPPSGRCRRPGTWRTGSRRGTGSGRRSPGLAFVIMIGGCGGLKKVSDHADVRHVIPGIPSRSEPRIHDFTHKRPPTHARTHSHPCSWGAGGAVAGACLRGSVPTSAGGGTDDEMSSV